MFDEKEELNEEIEDETFDEEDFDEEVEAEFNGEGDSFIKRSLKKGFLKRLKIATHRLRRAIFRARN